MTAGNAAPTRLDPVTLEVLWNRLLSVANEQQAALMRTAFSTVVRESQDLACGVFDTRGQMMAQSLTGTPGHINPMATGVRHLLAAYPPETLGPGDVLITNDPWMTSGQLNDFTVVTPVFREGRIVGYFGNLCHAADIGGQVFSGEAHEIYEEGLRVPVTKLFDRGEPNHELLKIIRANVRLPDETVGDLYAQASCNDVGGRALLAMMDEFGLESVDPLADEIIARSERALREAIRSLPDGVYRARGLERRVRGADRDRGDRHGRRRRDRHRLRRVVAAERAWHQRGAELHPRLRLLRAQSGDRPGRAAQRGLVPAGARHRAARLDPQLRRPGGGRGAAPDRALRARRHLRRAGPGAAGAAAGGRRRPDLAQRLARRAPGERRAVHDRDLPGRGHRARAPRRTG